MVYYNYQQSYYQEFLKEVSVKYQSTIKDEDLEATFNSRDKNK